MIDFQKVLEAEKERERVLFEQTSEQLRILNEGTEKILEDIMKSVYENCNNYNEVYIFLQNLRSHASAPDLFFYAARTALVDSATQIFNDHKSAGYEFK